MALFDFQAASVGGSESMPPTGFTRVLEGNPEWLNLRLLQSITSSQAAATTLVLGLPDRFVPMKTGKGAAHIESPNEF